MADHAQSLVLRPNQAVYRRHQIRSILWWSVALGLLTGGVIVLALGVNVGLVQLVLGLVALVALFAAGFFLSVLGGGEGWGLASGETWTVGHNGVDFDNAEEGHSGHLAFRDIADVSAKHGSAVQLRLTEGRAVVIRYLDDPAAAVQVIEARRQKAMATS